jgi:hypothetical protein
MNIGFPEASINSAMDRKDWGQLDGCPNCVADQSMPRIASSTEVL